MPATTLIMIALLLFVAVIMLIIRRFVPRYGYTWLAAVIGAFLAWVINLLSRYYIPQIYPLNAWQFGSSSSYSLALSLDTVSWVFAVAITTLLLAVLLTDVVRATETDWSAWTSSLIITAFGLFAIFAANPLTLLFAWAAIDFTEFLVMLWHVPGGSNRQQIVLALSTRIGGTFLLLWAWIIGFQIQPGATFEYSPQGSSVFLLLAAWVRLGIVPIQMPQIQELSLSRGLGTLGSLVPAAASLILIVRTADIGVLPSQMPYILILTGIGAFYGSFSWFYSQTELEGRSYWIISLSALSLASAVISQPSASLAWSLTAVLTGGLLFLYSYRGRFHSLFPILGLISLSILPLTLTWNGSALYQSPITIILVVFLLSPGLLLAGYFRHSRAAGQIMVGIENWVWVVYTIGLVAIAAFQFIIGFWVNFEHGDLITPISIHTIWPGVVMIALAAGMITAAARGVRLSSRGQTWVRSIFSLNWFYWFGWRIYRFIGRIVTMITFILEGEGGLLWVLLLILLAFILTAQRRIGGI